jgi:hypothetical protein
VVGAHDGLDLCADSLSRVSGIVYAGRREA